MPGAFAERRAGLINKFVMACSVVVVMLASPLLAQDADALSSEIDPALTTFETVQVADGIYAFISPESKAPMVSGNSVAIIGQNAVLVVDSGHFTSVTRKMIAEIRRLTSKPVRYLVNTHWHADHVTGNGVYRAQFPGVIIMSTPPTRERLANPLPKYDDRAQMAQAIPALEKLLKAGTGGNGSPLSAEARTYYQIMLNDAKVALPEFEEPKVPPSLTFTDTIQVDLGNCDVEIRFLGRGHSAGDAVVYVPGSKVLITGDLVATPFPYTFGSFINEWISTLKQLSKYDAAAIIPGHGPVEHDQRYLQQDMALLESLSDQVNKRVQEGLSLEQVRSKVDFREYREKMAGQDYFRRRAFDSLFVAPGVERAYREAKEGKLQDEN